MKEVCFDRLLGNCIFTWTFGEVLTRNFTDESFWGICLWQGQL